MSPLLIVPAPQRWQSSRCDKSFSGQPPAPHSRCLRPRGCTRRDSNCRANSFPHDVRDHRVWIVVWREARRESRRTRSITFGCSELPGHRRCWRNSNNGDCHRNMCPDGVGRVQRDHNLAANYICHRRDRPSHHCYPGGAHHGSLRPLACRDAGYEHCANTA